VPPAYVSGSRIKARVTTSTTSSADGASYTSSAFAGWYDSSRSEPCDSMIAADGKARCLPTSTGVQTGLNFYADASCTQPILMSPTQVACSLFPATPPPKYLLGGDVATQAGCYLTRVYPVTKVATPAGLYHPNGMGICAGPTAPPAGYDFYLGGAEIPAVTFAELTVTTTTVP
jgi:hypothetical protein